MKNKLRKITIDHKSYFWHRNHSHTYKNKVGKCVEIFKAWLKDSKQAPLIIIFSDDEKGVITNGGWGGHEGSLTLTQEFNLNLPSLTTQLIQLAVQKGWNPQNDASSFVIENGFEFLEELVKEK